MRATDRGKHKRSIKEILEDGRYLAGELVKIADGQKGWEAYVMGESAISICEVIEVTTRLQRKIQHLERALIATRAQAAPLKSGKK